MKRYTVRDLAQMALVTALYVVLTITPPLNAISSGMYQFRVSEMLNFLAFYNKKYIWSLTIGCMISNAPLFNPASLGAPDILIGGFSTLVFVSLGVFLFERFNGVEVLGGSLKLSHVLFSIFFAASMFTIALELHFLANLEFFSTWFFLFLGELSSLLVGAFVIKPIGDRVDLTQ